MKRILLYNFLFAFVLLSLFSCGNGSKFRNQLCALDSALVAHPDSIYEVLQGMKEEAVTHSKSDRMYFELLQADAQNKAYIDFTTDSVMLKVADYYDKHGTPNEQMRAHYLLGCTYRDLKDVPMELQCFQEAVEKVDTTRNDCEWGRMASIYGQIANIYHYQYLPEEELKALSKCEYYDHLNNDEYAATKSYELRMRAYYLLNNQDSILAISKRVYNRYTSLGYYQEAANTLCLSIAALVEKKNYGEARKYLRIYENYINENETKEHNKPIMYNHDKGVLLLDNNQVDSALICFNKLLSANEKEAAYNGLLLLYEKTNNADSIAKYAKLYAAANDSSYIDTNSEVIAQMTAVYNYSRQQNIAKAKELEAATNLRTLYLYIAFSFFVFIIILFVTIQLKQKKDKKISEMTNMYFEVISQKEAVLRDIDVLKAELVSKNSQQKDLKNALITKEKELISLQSQVDYYSKSLHLNKLEERVRAFTETSIFKKLKYSINFKNAEMKLTSSDWERFFHLYQQYFPTYYNNITTNTQINHDEKEVCLLLIFNFTTKELSAILCKSMPRISNIRASINKKLFNIDSATTLDDNIRKLFR